MEPWGGRAGASGVLAAYEECTSSPPTRPMQPHYELRSSADHPEMCAYMVLVVLVMVKKIAQLQGSLHMEVWGGCAGVLGVLAAYEGCISSPPTRQMHPHYELRSLADHPDMCAYMV
jgi:hypothetical protein